MTHAQKIAFEYFKRNPEAQSVHVVNRYVFANCKQAHRWAKAAHAPKVLSYLRTELMQPEQTNVTEPEPININIAPLEPVKKKRGRKINKTLKEK